jgi:peptidoglycan/LPS O-acetylase OafA/YrhL
MITDNIVFISELFIIPIVCIALGMVYVMGTFMIFDIPKHRYMSLDGLRGFLALFVFIHHSSMWYMLSHTHQWVLMDSTMFAHFGFTSVMLFFMITAFLFFSKLIDNYNEKIDWLKLYTSRVFRIAPLYLFAVLAIVMIVGYCTHFELKEPLGKLILHIGQWVLMMEPDINGMRGTKFVICGVQWSLAYEWLFYFSLATIGLLCFKLKPSIAIVLVSLLLAGLFIVIIYYYYLGTFSWDMIAFAGGIAAAFISRNARARKILSSDWFSVACLLLQGCAFLYKPSSWSFIATIPFFIVVSCGNDLFGILSWRPCLLLGQMSYSIYLLHGLLLFFVFYIIIGLGGPHSLLPTFTYWLIICGICVLLILMCSFTYRYIERAGIMHGDALSRRVHKITGI